MKIKDLNISITYDGRTIGRTPIYHVGVRYIEVEGVVPRVMYDYLTKAAIEPMISNLIDKLGGEKENATK